MNENLKKTSYLFNILLKENNIENNNYNIEFFLSVLKFFIVLNNNNIEEILNLKNVLIFKIKNFSNNENPRYIKFLFNKDAIQIKVTQGQIAVLDFALYLKKNNEIIKELINQLENMIDSYEGEIDFPYDIKTRSTISLLINNFSKISVNYSGRSFELYGFVFILLFSRFISSMSTKDFCDIILGINFIYNKKEIDYQNLFIDRMMSYLYSRYNFISKKDLFTKIKGNSLKSIIRDFVISFDQDWVFSPYNGKNNIVIEILKTLSLFDEVKTYCFDSDFNMIGDFYGLNFFKSDPSLEKILFSLERINYDERIDLIYKFVINLDNIFNKLNSMDSIIHELSIFQTNLYSIFEKKEIMMNVDFLDLFLNSLFEKFSKIKKLIGWINDDTNKNLLVSLDECIFNYVSFDLLNKKPMTFIKVILNTTWKFDAGYFQIIINDFILKQKDPSFFNSISNNISNNKLLIIFFVKIMYLIIGILLSNKDTGFYPSDIIELTEFYSKINNIYDILHNLSDFSEILPEKMIDYFVFFNGLNNYEDNKKFFNVEKNYKNISDYFKSLESSLWFSNSIDEIQTSSLVCDMLNR